MANLAKLNALNPPGSVFYSSKDRPVFQSGNGIRNSAVWHTGDRVFTCLPPLASILRDTVTSGVDRLRSIT